jgi:hypothetical protein
MMKEEKRDNAKIRRETEIENFNKRKYAEFQLNQQKSRKVDQKRNQERDMHARRSLRTDLSTTSNVGQGKDSTDYLGGAYNNASTSQLSYSQYG